MTESVQGTSEDVKTATSKPNPKPLKASNDNAEHGKPSEKAERPLTKVVVRHLPPTMTLELFLEQVSPLPPVDYMYFVKADSSLGLLSFSRAYLNFVNVQDLIIFTEKFDNYVFIDAKGNEYPAIVEFAPFQRIPKQRTNRKKDPRAGTIENDPYYLDFVEALKAEEAQRKSASKTNKQHFFETTSTNTTAQKVTSTPLLEYLKARKLDKIRVKEDKINEKKKRELERKKAREERSSGRQGEGDAHPVKVVTPPHGRNDRNESGTTHSPSVRHSDDKRPAREVKRREDDRATRTRDRDRERDTDARPKDSKKPGKSYQEERQRLSERRQTAKAAPSRPEKEAEEGGGEGEGASARAEDGRRPEKVARPAKAQDSKKTPERPRRPERKPVSPKESHKEERKKSYAQERELRRNSVKKDGPTTSEEARPNPKGDGPADKGAAEKGEQPASSSKGKDPRAERRIRNKDRPSIEIYRPGMGRFSRQRLEREKGSVVGSSTERDSASPSPSPSPSPSVSRAASVTAKPMAHSKDAENPPNQPAPSSESVKTEGTAASKEDKDAKKEDIAAEADDKSPKTEDNDAKTEDKAPTEDIAAKSEDARSDDVVAETEDSADKAVKTEDTLATTEDVTAKSEDTAKTGDEKDAHATVIDIATKTEKAEDCASKVEDTTSKTEDEKVGSSSKAEGEPCSANKTEETFSKTGEPLEIPDVSAADSSCKDDSVKEEDSST